jgi:hypothetical protein
MPSNEIVNPGPTAKYGAIARVSADQPPFTFTVAPPSDAAPS